MSACNYIYKVFVSFRVLPFGVGSARSSSSLASVTNNVPYDRSQDLMELEGSTSLSRVSTPPEIPDTNVYDLYFIFYWSNYYFFGQGGHHRVVVLLVS